jgi:hypothetical protein
MKSTHAGRGRDWISRGSVVVIAGFAMSVLAQNGCSGSSDEGVTVGTASDSDAGDQLSGCFAGETLTQIGKGTLCCSGTSPNLVCHNEGPRVGDPCDLSNAASSQETLTVTLDVCVSDSCDGEHTPTTFDAKTVAVTTPITCSNGAVVQNGASTTQEVDRVCAAVGTPSCPTQGYGYGYSYGYGYGATGVTTRAVSVASSTCTVGSSAPTPCGVGDF